MVADDFYLVKNIPKQFPSASSAKLAAGITTTITNGSIGIMIGICIA
jgi:hypothetical protein